MTTELTTESFNIALKASHETLTLVDFWAPWCAPCRVFAPTYERLAEELPNIEFFKVNVDENQRTAIEYEVRTIPMVVFLKEGEVVGRVTGTSTSSQLKSKIEELG